MPAYSLNVQQQQAVDVDGRIVLVNSVVGSGKTTVLVEKIRHLHQQQGVGLAEMMVLTFTRKAAEEINARVRLRIPGGDLPYCGTFHSVANRLLREQLDLTELGLEDDFSIIEEGQKEEILRWVAHENKIKVTKKILREIGRFEVPSPKAGLLQRLYNEYKRENNLVDFPDLILHLDTLLNKQQLRFKWLIVDEFQDIDSWQADILKKLLRQGASLFAVGDPEQTIYSWRGSTPQIFAQFGILQGAQQVALSQNYRSTATIIEGVRSLFAGKELRASRPPGPRVQIRQHYNAFHEANYLAARIKEQVEGGLLYSQIACLFRRQAQREIVEKVFTQEQIPFVPKLPQSLSEIPVLEWLHSLLSACSNDKNLASIVFVEKHARYGDGKDPDLREKIAKFVAQASGDLSPEALWQYFDLNRYLRPTRLSFEEDQAYVLAFLAEMYQLANDELSRWQRVLRYREFDLGRIFQKVKKFPEQGVHLLTLHSSKGLEFSQVYLLGVNEGNLPLRKQNEEEERRLLFVGMSRARDYLEISYLQKPELHGVSATPSPFLQQIAAHVTEWDQATTEKPDLLKLSQEVKSEQQQEQAPAAQKVEHEKYGVGQVIAEDDNEVVVEFPGYGEKSFSRVFCPLKFID